MAWAIGRRASHQGNLCCVLGVVHEKEKGLNLDGGHVWKGKYRYWSHCRDSIKILAIYLESKDDEA